MLFRSQRRHANEILFVCAILTDSTARQPRKNAEIAKILTADFADNADFEKEAILDCLCAIGGMFHLGDIDLDHLRHRLHSATGAVPVGVFDQLH